MPTYSYRCTACEHAFDIQQAFSDESLTTCPECGKALRKVFNAIGVTFQGSGFYRNDSRAENKKASSTPAKESTGTPSTPAGTKPAGSKPGASKPAGSKSGNSKPAATPSSSS
jgi:putative FmdB family regulatory protein